MAELKTLEIGSLDELLTVVDKARTLLEAENEEECFFRGHRVGSWPLQPTLQRTAGRHKWGNKTLLEKENSLFWEFQARASELHDQSLMDWDYLFAMRHAGVPTRLLDWSESFAVALFFALRDSEEKPREAPCIWVLNPYRLNEEADWGRDLVTPRYLGWNEEEKLYYDYGDLITEPERINWKMPLAIYPMQRQRRMRAQRGWFTIQGTDQKPLEVQAPECLVKLTFAEGVAEIAGGLLDLLGFDRYAIYTDLDSLAESVTRKNVGLAQPVPKSKK